MSNHLLLTHSSVDYHEEVWHEYDEFRRDSGRNHRRDERSSRSSESRRDSGGAHGGDGHLDPYQTFDERDSRMMNDGDYWGSPIERIHDGHGEDTVAETRHFSRGRSDDEYSDYDSDKRRRMA